MRPERQRSRTMNIDRKHGPGKSFRLAALCALALAFAQPALAQGEFASAQPQAKVSASATVSFRIVVRETVRMDAQALVANVAPRDLRSPPQQRQVDLLDGMQRVTLARP
ncbi:MAG: hypothetical protein ABS41_08705 [Arenimonas sp. SCN 70-307]|nr:MAG: hypothetical protein ABS41_08705 [Arenimonas sp. SCN 70-307]